MAAAGRARLFHNIFTLPRPFPEKEVDFERDVVEKIAGRGALASVEGYFKKYGTRTILVCRLLPFVSFDAGDQYFVDTEFFAYR